MKRRRDGSLKVYLALSKSVYLNYFAYLKECGKEPDEMFPEVVSYIPGIWRGVGECQRREGYTELYNES